MTPPDPDLSRTVADGNRTTAPRNDGATIAGEVGADVPGSGSRNGSANIVGSGTAGGSSPAPPPRLPAASFGELLRLRGLDPDENEPEGLRYRIERALGRGSGGGVWAAHDLRLARPIAIKVLNRGGDRKHFVEEARITAELQHPNVLPVYDLDLTEDGDPCFAMKRVEGMSLGEALKATPRPSAVAGINGLVSVFIAVGHALAYAHNRGVIHQDIKPDNILLGGFGEVLLGDWGCAVRSVARGGRLYGTPLYMAPEQARREFADTRSDIYCFGATLFDAVIGRPPTIPDDDADVFWKRKCAGVIDDPTAAEREHVPAALVAIALKALAADPDARYARVEDLLADLHAYQSGLAVSVHREGLRRVLLRWYRHHRSQFWTALVALIVVAAAGGLWYRDRLRESSAWREVLVEDFRDPAATATHWRAMAIAHGWPLPPAQEVAFTGAPGVVLKNGRMECGDTDLVVDVALRNRIYGSLAVEWDCTPLRGNLNLNCFLGDDRQSGYTFHVGGWGDPSYVAMTRGKGNDGEGGTMLACGYLDKPLVRGEKHHFRFERDEDRLSLAIDGTVVISREDPVDPRAVGAQSFGFDSWYECVNAISDVHLWTRPLPERISPLITAGVLLASGDRVSALRQYRGLATAYAGRDLGIEAAFRAGFIALRAEPGPATEAALDALVANHPHHPLAPFALAENHAAALLRGDREAAERERTSLLAYPGHQAQQQALFDLGAERIPSVNATQSAPADRWVIPVDAMATITAEIAEIEAWSKRYDLQITANRFLSAAGVTVQRCGRDDLILAHWPLCDHARGEALLETGDPEEALRHWSHLSSVTLQVPQRALRALDRREGLAAYGREGALIALDLAHDVAGMRRDFPHEDITAVRLIAAGSAAEIVADPAFSTLARAWALLALDRAAEALPLVGDKYQHVHQRACCLLALGREDEVLADCQQDFQAAWQVWLRRIQRGDQAGADALLATLRGVLPDYSVLLDLETYHLIPALIQCSHGQGAAARETLAATLATTRTCTGQRFWHIAAYATGHEDEAAFRAQPWKEDLAQHLLLAQAMRSEFAGDAAAAHAAWTAWLAGDHSMDREDIMRAVAAWRLAH